MRRDEHHRAAGAGNGKAEEPRKAAPPDKQQRQDGAYEPAEAGGRAQIADSAGTEVQKLERGKGEEHVHRTVDQRLRRKETEQELQAPVAGDRPEAIRGLLPDRTLFLP